MKMKRILFSIAVTAIIITATANCFAFGGISILGYEKDTCTLQKDYHQPTYLIDNTVHGVSLHQERDKKSAKVQMLTASLQGCYVITAVYSNNGTLTGVHYKTEVARTPSLLANAVTAKVSIGSSVNVRSVIHFASHPNSCDGKEHIFYHYDASHPNDPE